MKIDLLLLPKIEIGDLTDGICGEAELFYKSYLKGGQSYAIKGLKEPLYVKDGVALIITGEGKVNAAKSVALTLADDRFDFSDAYFLSCGCAGSSTLQTVLGDVFVITSVFDYDLGHKCDVRELANTNSDITWFNDAAFDEISHFNLDEKLSNKVYDLVKDTNLMTTPKTLKIMAKSFDNAPWAIRNPKVLKGSGCTSDSYWKGEYGEKQARYIADYYKLKDPYLASEMEDNAIAQVLNDYGYLNRLVIIRTSVNMDVFFNGAKPESLWTNGFNIDKSITNEEKETADIFPIAMENLFNTTSKVIEAIKNHEL